MFVVREFNHYKFYLIMKSRFEAFQGIELTQKQSSKIKGGAIWPFKKKKKKTIGIVDAAEENIAPSDEPAQEDTTTTGEGQAQDSAG